MEPEIIDKKEIELGKRRIEVKLIECDRNQHGEVRIQRVSAKFLDHKRDRVMLNNSTKKISIGMRVLTEDQVKMLKRVLREVPDED